MNYRKIGVIFCIIGAVMTFAIDLLPKPATEGVYHATIVVRIVFLLFMTFGLGLHIGSDSPGKHVQGMLMETNPAFTPEEIQRIRDWIDDGEDIDDDSPDEDEYYSPTGKPESEVLLQKYWPGDFEEIKKDVWFSKEFIAFIVEKSKNLDEYRVENNMLMATGFGGCEVRVLEHPLLDEGAWVVQEIQNAPVPPFCSVTVMRVS